MQIKKTEFPNYSLIEILLDEGEILRPESLKSISFPEINLSKGIVLSGRAPIWLFSFASHFFHPSAWVAIHDPRLLGYVVAQTHSPDVKIGEIIPAP